MNSKRKESTAALVNPCHVDGCRHSFGNSNFLCKRHEFYVRKELRQALLTEPYESIRLIAVRRRATAEVVFLCHGGEMAGPYIEDAERWRKIAFDRGEGDPLETLSKIPLRTRHIRGEVEIREEK